jgi:putative ABC transport system ATP-binding protein
MALAEVFMTDVTELELRRVSKRYASDGAEQAVLREVDLALPRGDYLVVIGRSGSGKSTLLNLLGALDLPTSGQLLFRGRDLAELDETARADLRRRDIGFVFQACNLIPTLTVLENLLVPLQLNDVARGAAQERCAGLLEAAGLARYPDRFPEELSGGEQQRVAVLRAIVHEPAVVIADEPTGNLDLATACEVLDLLERFCQEEGRTLVMATHSREVMGRARRVLRMVDGRLEPAD